MIITNHIARNKMRGYIIYFGLDLPNADYIMK